jgi:hypothetical protein
MGREFSFGDVIARAKECFGVAKDTELAALLGISPQTLNNRKKTESIPFDELLGLAIKWNVDIAWLLTGQRSQPLPISVAVPAGLDLPRFKLAIEAVEEGLEAVQRRMPPDKKAELVLAAYDLLDEPSPEAKSKILNFIRLAA